MWQRSVLAADAVVGTGPADVVAPVVEPPAVVARAVVVAVRAADALPNDADDTDAWNEQADTSRAATNMVGPARTAERGNGVMAQR